MENLVVALEDIINVRELPRDLKEWDLFVLAYDGIRNWKLYFAFKNIGKPLDELPL